MGCMGRGRRSEGLQGAKGCQPDLGQLLLECRVLPRGLFVLHLHLKTHSRGQTKWEEGRGEGRVNRQRDGQCRATKTKGSRDERGEKMKGRRGEGRCTYMPGLSLCQHMLPGNFQAHLHIHSAHHEQNRTYLVSLCLTALVLRGEGVSASTLLLLGDLGR